MIVFFIDFLQFARLSGHMVEKILTVKANLDLPTMGPEIYDSDDDESDLETELDQINMQDEIENAFDSLE